MFGLIDLVQLAIMLGVILISLSFHEAAHAAMATALGDPTPSAQGRLTLNPIKHLDPYGTLLIVITALAGFGLGWGKPVVVNPNNLRPGPFWGMGLVAAAGPASNLLLAAVAAPFVREVEMGSVLGDVVIMVLLLNIGLAVFNLLPIPPLDGYRIAAAVLPRPITFTLYRYEQQMFMGLLAAFFLLPMLGIHPVSWVVTPVARSLAQLFIGALHF